MKFNTKMLFLFLICCFLSQAFSEYVSKMGKEILSRCDLIVKGSPVSVLILNQGGKMLTFKVESVFYGKAKLSQNIYIVLLELPVFSKEESWVVFLKSLSSGYMYESLGDFSLKGKDSSHKLIALEKILQMEFIQNQELKLKQYIKLCLEGMGASDLWTAFHWLKEWQHLLDQNPDVLEENLLQELQKIYDQAIHDDIKEKIKKNLLTIKKQKPQEKEKIPEGVFWKKMQEAKRKITGPASLSEKEEALHILGFFPSSLSQEALITSLKDDSPYIRAMAAFYLGCHQNPQSIPALIEILKTDTHLRVKKNAIRSLAQLRAKEAIPLIEPYTELPYTKQIAQKALQFLRSF